jgi:hypothetical protein
MVTKNNNVMIFVLALTLWTAPASQGSQGRIHISQADVNPGYVINQAGSYIVTESIQATGVVAAITVNADDVLLDLNGHTIEGSALAPFAVFQNPVMQRLTVRNGAIRNFNATGAVAFNLQGHGNVVERIRMTSCPQGIRLGENARVRDVELWGGPPLTGAGFGVQAGSYARLHRVQVVGMQTDSAYTAIETGARSALAQCRVVNNTAGTPFTGIRMGAHSSLTASDVTGNTGTLLVTGLSAGSNSVVHASTVSRNTGLLASGLNVLGPGVVAGSTASQNSGSGIQAGPGAMVVENIAFSNTLAGIILNGYSFALQNHVTQNGLSEPTGGGIIAAQPGNRIEKNSALFNRTGIRLNATNNVVIANRTAQNVTTNILVTVTPNHVGLRRVVTGAFSEKNGMANLDH